MKKIFSLSIALLSVTVFNSFAQTFGGEPLSFSQTNLSANIPEVNMPEVDVAPLLAEDELNVGKNMPYRFGYNQYVSINADAQGTWETISDGSKIWRLKIICPDALSINISFDDFNLPKGAKFFMYTPAKNFKVGAYTFENNLPDHFFGTDLVPGSEVILEYNEPAFVSFHGELNIYRITHGYKDAFSFVKNYGDAGSCQMNVNCPSGAPWVNERNAVACIIDGGGICTGALVADVPHSGTPYFLTANHCTSGATVSTWVYRFNWEAPSCANFNSAQNHTVNGCTLRAKDSPSDFCLVELSSMPQQSYTPFMAGWNRQNAPSTSSCGIHHPSADIKKISFDNGATVSGTFPGCPANSHWVVDWDGGPCTEGGSSGSPLFDQNHRITGQLHGGASACGSSDMTDEYGKFSYSWSTSTNITKQLQHWLDPDNTGNLTDDGYDPWAPTDSLNLALINFTTIASNLCLGDTLFPAVKVKNKGQNPITSFTIQCTVDGGASQNYNWVGGSMAYNTTMIVNLPFIVPAAGNHIYALLITVVNGITDQQILDDTLSSPLNVINGEKLFITLTTDNNGSETSIEIKNTSGAVMNAWAGFANNTIYNLEACLPAGCYTFNIYDAGANGICCTNGNGHFHAEDIYSHIIVDGGTFTSAYSKQFCLGIPVTADFTITDNTICQGKPVNTTNTSVDAYTYAWTLTGPSTTTSANTTFSYTPSLVGIYTLTLIANNGGSYDTTFQTFTVVSTPTINYSNTQTSSAGATDASIDVSLVGGTSPFTYVWSSNANGATTQDLAGIGAGTYCVTVTDVNGCTKSQCIMVPAGTGIAELYFSVVKVFPNPANNQLEVDLAGIHLSSLILFDEVGRKISVTRKQNGSQILFDLSNVAAGVYFLQGENSVGTFTRKIVVVHP